MKKILSIVVFIFIILTYHKAFAGAFSMSFYGNIDGEVLGTRVSNITTNARWEGQSYDSYVQLQLSGRDLSGFELWTQIGANVNLSKAVLKNDYVIYPLSTSLGINTNYQGDDANNYLIRQFQAHIQKNFKIKKGDITLAMYRGQDRTDVSQPYLDFFGDVGDGDTKTGIQWNVNGLLGFTTKGYILDYRSDARDSDPNVADIHAYMFGGRISRNLLKKTYLNILLGVTGGASQYFKTYSVADVFSTTSFGGYTNKYFYNILGADLTLNGSLKVLGDYYFFIGAGRSYAPETYPFEQRSGIAWLGNTNSLMLISDFKWNKSFQVKDIDLGKIFFSAYLSMRQPNYQIYLGGGNENKFQESLFLTYNFPVKAVSLNGRMEYLHDYEFTNTQYHIWSVGVITDPSVVFKRHLDLNLLLKQGFSFNIAFDNEKGQTYVGDFIPEGVNYLTTTFAGESELGRIAPQFKIVAMGDTNKQLVSSGIEILLNISKTTQFYSRYAYVSSKGYWTKDGDITWWDAFMQLQFRSGNNSRITVEYGNSGGTDNNFVSDKDLINGSSFENKFSFRFEYWI